MTGHILVADSGNSRIRALDLATGAVTTLLGGPGAVDADGPAASARLQNPTALATAPAPDGTVYVADAASGAVRALRR